MNHRYVRSSLPPTQNGFALVVTLSLMILLTVIAVGLLSLSAVSLRTAGQSSAMSEARANARLALLLALGDLQKHAGPDQRITAPGGILDPSAAHPHWIGTWDSWKAGSETSADDEPSQHATIADGGTSGLAPRYQPSRSGHFRQWLVSGTDPLALRSVDHARSGNLADSVSPAAAATSVTLVSTGSLGDAPDADKVKSGLIPLARQGGAANGPKAGRIGWWVGDESLKARVKEDPYLKDSSALTDSSRAFRAQSPGRAHYRMLPGMDQIKPDARFNLVHSRRSTELLEGVSDTIDSSFHHSTPYSLGIL
ncbi:MAG: hypothetical protein MUF13_09885, partial [Akkermansiaceae bacterium]|nr:hypothetical protein [Akkermansiaceae bacterium]